MNNKKFLIYEGEKYICFYKESGLPTTYRNDEDKSDSLIDRVKSLRPDLIDSVKGYKDREGGLIYRLDNDTAGYVIFAKDTNAFNQFLDLQEKNCVLKKYYAEVSDWSHIDSSELETESISLTPILDNLEIELPHYFENELPIDTEQNRVNDYFTLDLPIGHSRKSKNRMIAIIGRNYKVRGKPKIRNTYFRKIGEKNGVSLLEVLIEKGIRHQIRVHLASPGIPIIGDKLYGKNRTQSIQRSVPDSESLHLFSAGIYSKEGDIQ